MNTHSNTIPAYCLALWLLILAIPFGPVFASGLTNADEIVRRANHAALYPGDDNSASVRMVITDKLGRTRKRDFNTLRKNHPAGNGDQFYLIYFKSPADVRKMTFMVHKHDSPARDDDRWLYLPNLDLVKRIAAGDKRTSFAGSDFLYEDISGRNIHEDRHVLREVTDRYYVIDNIPVRPESVSFSHYIATIDKETFLPVRQEFFDTTGAVTRTIEATEVAQIPATENGKDRHYPVITCSVAKNMASGSVTEMRVSGIRFNTGVSDTLFSERYLRRPPRRLLR